MRDRRMRAPVGSDVAEVARDERELRVRYERLASDLESPRKQAVVGIDENDEVAAARRKAGIARGGEPAVLLS